MSSRPSGGSPAANIPTASDAIWWAYVTITTVGYGGRSPVTQMGRLIGILVLTTGVAVFATFAGYISSKLLGTAEEEEEPAAEPRTEEDRAATCLAEVNRLLAERERLDTEIVARLVVLEQLLSEGAPGDAGEVGVSARGPPFGPIPPAREYHVIRRCYTGYTWRPIACTSTETTTARSGSC